MNFDCNTIRNANDKLVTYTKNAIPIMGVCNLNIQFNNKKINAIFHVNKDPRESILGLKAITELGIIKISKQINSIQDKSNKQYSKLINKYGDIFEGIGNIGKPYRIEIQQNAIPIVKPVRNIPFALENKFKDCLKDMEKAQIIERVHGSVEWINSFVIVKKNDNSIRVCLDPQELNKVIKSRTYKLPNMDEIMSKLSGSKYFSTLDAASGFWNIPLDKNSSKLCTFGTPFGRYRFLRMPFGIKTASEVFQENFKDIFTMKGVELYIDDILIHAKNKEEHDIILKQVFDAAKKHNVKFNLEKCKLGLREVKYLGHKFSEKGIRLDENRIEAIKEMPTPKNKKDVQRFLGMITYVGKFIENLSEKHIH